MWVNMGRVSTVRSHDQRDAIDAALAAGDSYATIADRFGLSLAAVGRYAIQQRGELARMAAGEASAVDLVTRLLRAADDARELRELTKKSAPATRVRTIKLEIDATRPLLTELGVSDETLQSVYTQTAALIKLLVAHGKRYPDDGSRLFYEMAKDPELADIGRTLARTLPSGGSGES